MAEIDYKRTPGQRNMYVVGMYKERLLHELMQDEDFHTALQGVLDDNKENAPESFDAEDQELFKSFKESVYDYAFVPGTTNVKNIFVCMEITCPYADAVTWKDLYIHVYVFTPKMSVAWSDAESTTRNALITKGYVGNKIDMVVDIVDRKLNGFKDLALGSIRLAPREGMQVFSYIDGYYGKQLTYTATDFNILPPDVIKGDYTNGSIPDPEFPV